MSTLDTIRTPGIALEGFTDIRRTYLPKLGMYGARILPGELYVTSHEEAVVTTLGSCVSACIRDTKLGLGGMNHFMLPGEGSERQKGLYSEAARYGVDAMEQLINHIQRNGGLRRRMEIKIFGGADMIRGSATIGYDNVDFVKEYLAMEGLDWSAEDLGDIYARKVIYFPATGKVRIGKIKSVNATKIVEAEDTYKHDLDSRADSGSEIELF